MSFFFSRALTISTTDPSTEILDPKTSPYPAPSPRRHTEGVVNAPAFQRNGKNSQFIRKPNVKSSRSTKKRPKRTGSTGSESGQSQESGEVLGAQEEEVEVADKVSARAIGL